jgi:hypothetical protein
MSEEEQEQLPDWLLSMRGQSLEEPPMQQSSVPPFPEIPSREEKIAPPVEPLAGLEEEEETVLVQEQADQSDSDMVDFLRDMVQPDEELDDFGYGEESKVSGVIPGMKPWQGLVLVVLFALDVIVCGAMVLAMLGRIGF